MQTHHKNHQLSHSPSTQQPSTHTTHITMDDVDDEQEEETPTNFPTPNASFFLTKLISLQADILYTIIISFFSPFFSILSFIFDFFRQPEATKESETAIESAAHAVGRVPSSVAHGGVILLKKLGFGFLGATYVCMVLILVMIFSVILGVGLVQLWVEEPVYMRESLHFDYTDVHPSAVFSFRGGGGVDTDGFEGYGGDRNKNGVPVGHTLYVSLGFLMPESDYNREIGVFQVIAELISRNGDILAISSNPCMLRFSSWPIRLTRTFFMGIPLLLGITTETQRISTPMLKHKEGFPRTEAIRITLVPRAGTTYLPQFYEAEIFVNSQLPWKKAIIYRWKWTFYVWTSFYIYLLLLIVLFCYFRPLVFPVITIASSDRRDHEVIPEALTERKEKAREERDVSESLRRWHQNRSKRKAMYLQRSMPEDAVGSSASSITLTRDDTGGTVEDDAEDSESVC